MSHGVIEYKVLHTARFRTLQKHVKSAGLCSVSGASGGGLAGWEVEDGERSRRRIREPAETKRVRPGTWRKGGSDRRRIISF
ncbi:hypothetical protein AALO_G00246270 [Alosa alosa]|uniref:Uncharacterized protein n=1 Tax=Alosa alosa TaxID=278164 RepID=A0AAV6FXB5_9TELE|nr:hypothetical protein AALO_G00246270 [Alosa alosa]